MPPLRAPNIVGPHLAATMSATAAREGQAISGTWGIALAIPAVEIEKMSLAVRKPNFGVSDQV